MNYLKYVIEFVLIFVFIYLFYLIMIVNPQLSYMRKKKKGKNVKKEKKEPTDILLLRNYYGVDIEKVGLIRTFRIINFVIAVILSIIVMVVLPLKAVWLKIVIIAVLIVPVIWVTYYFIAKYLKYLERKSENV